MEEGYLKRLMTGIKCSACGRHYEVDNVNVLGHREDLWLLSAFCTSCRTRYMVAAVVKEDKAPKVVTDLDRAELIRFRNAPVITAENVLDMHDFLKDFDGDFSRLF